MVRKVTSTNLPPVSPAVRRLSTRPPAVASAAVSNGSGGNPFTWLRHQIAAHWRGIVTAAGVVLVVGTIVCTLATDGVCGLIAVEEAGLGGAAEDAGAAGGDLTRVGRWMSPAEHEAMTETGMVQEAGGGTTYVASPADPAAYGQQAVSGSRYVEFDVPQDSLAPAGKEGWAQIPGPNSLYGRLAAMRGLPIPQFRPALNIEWLMTK